jgi:hypothetical protein
MFGLCLYEITYLMFVFPIVGGTLLLAFFYSIKCKFGTARKVLSFGMSGLLIMGLAFIVSEIIIDFLTIRVSCDDKSAIAFLFQSASIIGLIYLYRFVRGKRYIYNKKIDTLLSLTLLSIAGGFLLIELLD